MTRKEQYKQETGCKQITSMIDYATWLEKKLDECEIYRRAWERLQDELCGMFDSYVTDFIRDKMEKIIKEEQSK